MIDKDDIRIRRHMKQFIPSRLEELQMSQADLARATGDSPTQINRAANGENTPSLAFALRIAKALNCSIEELSGQVEIATS